jgi:glycosyltransferase involved in cell wall biosynthesis
MMRIAFFNWRDIRHPSAGGAEAFAHQVLKRLIRRGHEATVFSSTFPGCLARETIDGIEHVRYGGRFLMYPESFLCYKRHVEGRYDVIVEGINGAPFFTVLFAKEKVVPLIYQLTRENWYSGLPFPLAFFGYHLENRMLGIYRKAPAATVSPSTRADLEGLGFHDITILPCAPDVAMPENPPLRDGRTVTYLGRLTKSKRVDHALRAFKSISAAVPGARLFIVGSGPQEKALRNLAGKLGIGGSTVFFGRVGDRMKAELLSRSSLLLLPAVREGWGLVVLEANAFGVPVVGYDVPGLRDSIKDGVNGRLVPSGDVDALADASAALLKGKRALGRLSASSLRYSEGFSWERSAVSLLAMLERVLR